VVSADMAEQCLAICKKQKIGKNASIIGEVRRVQEQALVEMKTRIGGKRIVQMPYGRELPRIC